MVHGMIMHGRWMFWVGAIALWFFAYLQLDDAEYRPGNPVVPWILFYALAGVCSALAAIRRLPGWLATGMIGAALAYLALSMPGAVHMLRGDHDIRIGQAMEWSAMTTLADHSYVEEFREAGGALAVLVILICARIWGRHPGRNHQP